MGVITDTTYENDALNIGFSLPDENWNIYTREEVDAVYNKDIEIFSDGQGNNLTYAEEFFDMYASDNMLKNSVSIGIVMTNENSSMISEETYARYFADNYKEKLAQMGFEDISINVDSVELMNEMHSMVVAEGIYDTLPYCVVDVLIKRDNGFIMISCVSHESIEQATATLGNFYRLSE